MKFSIVKPSVMMYKTSDLCGEVSDELLFGTSLEIISEDDTTAFCRTHYGYCGYINKWEMCECELEDCGDAEKVILQSRCDILYEPRYRLSPYMSLPRGARIKIGSRVDDRFSECCIGNKIYYIPNYAFKKRICDDIGDAVVDAALGYLGAPYRWGGKSDTGIDCSGFVFMAFALCNFTVFRDAVFDERYLYKINENDVQHGDVAYFKGHVVLMTGKESFIHSSASAGRVVIGNFGEGALSKDNVLCFARVRAQEK